MVFLGLPIMDVSVALVGTLDGGGIFYVHIRSIASAAVLFPMSCLGLVCGGDKERNGDSGGLRRNMVTLEITCKNHTPKGRYRFAMRGCAFCLPPPPPWETPQKLTDSILPYLPSSLCVMRLASLARDIASMPYIPPMHPPSATVVAVRPRFRFVFHMVPQMLKLHPYC